MADEKNVASIGGVGLDLTLNDSGLYAEVKQAADRIKAQFVREFSSIGKETDNSFKKSFSGVTASGKNAANNVKEQFTKCAKSAGAEVEKRLKSSFNEASNAGNSMTESLVGGLKKIGAAVITAFSIQKIKEFGQTAVEQAAKVIAQESALTQTFREYEGAATSAMQEVAKESGILETRLYGVGTQIYAFAKTSGMDSATALNMMKEALQTTADSAAYYDRSLEDTAESLKSFLKGNYANDAALGVSATETTRNAAAMKLYGQSFKDLSEAQKQLTLLQMVKDANALSGAMGQAAREADGWENVIGNLKEAWNQLLAAVGKPILQGAIVVVKRLTEWISNLATYAKAASQALGELFGWSSDETAVTAANTAQTASSISDSVDNQNQLTQAVAKTNAEVKRGIAGFDKLNLISKSTVNNVNENADKIDNINGAGVNAAVPVLDIDTNNVTNKIDELKEKIISAFQNLAENSGFNNFIDEFQKGLDKVDYKYIHENVEEIVKDVNDIAKETAPGIADMNKSFGTLTGSVAGLAAMISGKAAEVVSGGIRKWLDKDKQYIIDTTNEVTENMGSGFDNLSPIFQDLRDRAALFFDKIKPFTEGVIAEALSGVTHVLGEMAKTGSKAFETLAGSIKDLYFFMINEFAPNTLKTITDVINGIIDLWNQMSEALYGGIYNIGNGLGDLVKGFGSLFGQDWGWEMPERAPQLPHLATGGIVSAPTLAVVGDNPGAGSGNPEVIAPLNNLQGMISSSESSESTAILSKMLNVLTSMYEMSVIDRNSGGQTARLTAEMNGEPVFDEMIRLNDIYKARHGRSAFV